MFVCNEDLCHLFRLVACLGKSQNIILDPCSEVDHRLFVRNRIRSLFRHTRVDQYDLTPSINEVILERGAVTHGSVELLHPLFASERERLRHKSVLIKFHCLDFHSLPPVKVKNELYFDTMSG